MEPEVTHVRVAGSEKEGTPHCARTHTHTEYSLKLYTYVCLLFLCGLHFVDNISIGMVWMDVTVYVDRNPG